MGRLATVFNETLGRLEASFEQMRRFTADVSHELRTPLTAIRSVGEVGLRGHRDEAALPRDHRQHARGSRSAGEPGRSAADAVARRDAVRRRCRRVVDLARARRRGGGASRRAGRGEGADDRGRAAGQAAARRRPRWCCARRSSTSSTTRSSSARTAAASASACPRRRREAVDRRQSTPVPAFAPRRRDAHLRSLLSRRRWHGATARRRPRPVDREGGGRGQRRQADARSDGSNGQHFSDNDATPSTRTPTSRLVLLCQIDEFPNGFGSDHF